MNADFKSAAERIKRPVSTSPMQLRKLDLSFGLELTALKSDEVPITHRMVASVDRIRLSGEEATAFCLAYGKELESAPACDFLDAQCSLYDLRMFTQTVTANETMPDLARSLLTAFNHWRSLGIDGVVVYGNPAAPENLLNRAENEPGFQLPVVNGRRIRGSNADFERACLVHIDRLQHSGGPFDSAMLDTFCEAVRICREYSDAMQPL